jgi:CheR methyltransferase, SAM binding domain
MRDTARSKRTMAQTRAPLLVASTASVPSNCRKRILESIGHQLVDDEVDEDSAREADLRLDNVSAMNRAMNRNASSPIGSAIDGTPKLIERLGSGLEEARFLFRDLLISVTNFFRDNEAFEELEKTVILRLLEGNGADEVVRVWVPGCATARRCIRSRSCCASRWMRSAPPQRCKSSSPISTSRRSRGADGTLSGRPPR